MKLTKTTTGKSLLVFFHASLVGAELLRASNLVVVPNDLGFVVEGNDSSTLPFFIEQSGRSSLRYQQIYDAAQFSAVDPGYKYISAIYFRADSSVPSVGTWITNIQINLSTTSRSVTNLSPVFADNVGPDDTVVFGPQSLSIQGGGSGSPHAFNVGIALTKPFYYEPAVGNLLLDVINFTGGPLPVRSVSALDATTENSVSSSFVNSIAADSGTVVSGGLVTMFQTFPIPVRSPVLFVVPNDLIFVEGDNGSTWPFFIERSGLSSMRYQQAYDASQFTAVGPVGGYITDIFFRGDSSSRVGSTFITNIQINLSTTSKPVKGLSPVFAENVGADDTIVFGPAGLQFGVAPWSFGTSIHLVSKPFYYNPSAGNLLLDIRNFTGGPTTGPIEIPSADHTTESSLSSVYATNVAAGAGSGLIGGLVTEFVIAPPPALLIQEPTNSVIITWPTEPKVFVLQMTTNLNAAIWKMITNVVAGNGLYQTLTLPRDSLNSQRFFRLAWPSSTQAGN